MGFGVGAPSSAPSLAAAGLAWCGSGCLGALGPQSQQHQLLPLHSAYRHPPTTSTPYSVQIFRSVRRTGHWPLRLILSYRVESRDRAGVPRSCSSRAWISIARQSASLAQPPIPPLDTVWSRSFPTSSLDGVVSSSWSWARRHACRAATDCAKGKRATNHVASGRRVAAGWWRRCGASLWCCRFCIARNRKLIGVLLRPNPTDGAPFQIACPTPLRSSRLRLLLRPVPTPARLAEPPICVALLTTMNLRTLRSESTQSTDDRTKRQRLPLAL